MNWTVIAIVAIVVWGVVQLSKARAAARLPVAWIRM